MKEKILERLMSIKSLVTLALTIVFCALSVMGTIESEQFYQIFLVIIAFYFGSQAEKKSVAQ